MPILNDIPSCGICSLINLETKEHFTLYSSALPIELAKLIESLRKGTHSCKALVEAYKANKLTYKLLDNKSDDYSLYSLRAEYTEWLREFTRKGFTDLRPGHRAPTYRIIKKVYETYKPKPGPGHLHNNKLFVYVIAVSKRNNKLVLGVFETMSEAEEWVKATFPDESNVVPTFHDGSLSKGYREEFGERLIRTRPKGRRRLKKIGGTSYAGKVTPVTDHVLDEG